VKTFPKTKRREKVDKAARANGSDITTTAAQHNSNISMRAKKGKNNNRQRNSINHIVIFFLSHNSQRVWQEKALVESCVK